MKRILVAVMLMLFIAGAYSITINVNQISDGPPPCFEISIFHDGEPPTPITDFHFNVTSPGMIVSAEGMDGWTTRYALPNTFVEMDAENEEANIHPGEAGTFIICIEGPIEELEYDLYLTGPGGVIPGTEQSGSFEELKLTEKPDDIENSTFIYPNPFKDFCYINSPHSQNIKILDCQGRLLKSLPNASIWYPCDAIISGTYIISIDNSQSIKVNFVK